MTHTVLPPLQQNPGRDFTAKHFPFKCHLEKNKTKTTIACLYRKFQYKPSDLFYKDILKIPMVSSAHATHAIVIYLVVSAISFALMHITSPRLLTSFYILLSHIVFPPCYDNGRESSMFNEWLEAGCRFRNILVTVNMRSSSIICSHIIVFQGSSAKCAPTEAQIYFGRVSAHLLAVCLVQMLVSLNKLCTDTGSASFGSGRGKQSWKTLPGQSFPLTSSLTLPSPISPAPPIPHPLLQVSTTSHPHLGVKCIYIQSTEKWRNESRGSDTSNPAELGALSAVEYHIFLDKTRTMRSCQ